MRRSLPTVGFTIAALAAFAAPALAQSAGDLVERMLAEYTRRAEGVDDYTLVQQVMGVETELYFEKVMVDGRPTFQLKQSSAMGMSTMAAEQEGSLDEIYSFGARLAEYAEYGGTEQVNGHEVHVLTIEDMTRLPMGPTQMGDEEFTAKTGRVLVDAELLAPRRMEYDGELRRDSEVHEITMVVDLDDYREIGGMLFPYHTTMRMEGLAAMVDPEMRAQFEEMQRQLENVPEAQREMMQQMMAGQMERIEQMMEGDDGAMTVEMTVSEVRVNAGPPNR